MITRGDLILLGITAGVTGSLIGGLMLFAGLVMITSGAYAGWLLLLPAGPAGALIGWILARRLARQLPSSQLPSS